MSELILEPEFSVVSFEADVAEADLKTCEKKIEKAYGSSRKAMKTVVLGALEVAAALRRIRDGDLWEGGEYKDFPSYCNGRWGLTNRAVAYKIRVYDILRRLHLDGVHVEFPSERCVRMLDNIPEDDWADIVNSVVDDAGVVDRIRLAEVVDKKISSTNSENKSDATSSGPAVSKTESVAQNASVVVVNDLGEDDEEPAEPAGDIDESDLDDILSGSEEEEVTEDAQSSVRNPSIGYDPKKAAEKLEVVVSRAVAKVPELYRDQVRSEFLSRFSGSSPPVVKKKSLDDIAEDFTSALAITPPNVMLGHIQKFVARFKLRVMR